LFSGSPFKKIRLAIIVSGKAVGADRRLAHEIDRHLLEDAGSASSPVVLGVASALGDLNDPHVKKLFGYLVGTMNASYPDYDFRCSISFFLSLPHSLSLSSLIAMPSGCL
jgi:hypothetical protein